SDEVPSASRLRECWRRPRDSRKSLRPFAASSNHRIGGLEEKSGCHMALVRWAIRPCGRVPNALFWRTDTDAIGRELVDITRLSAIGRVSRLGCVAAATIALLASGLATAQNDAANSPCLQKLSQQKAEPPAPEPKAKAPGWFSKNADKILGGAGALGGA